MPELKVFSFYYADLELTFGIKWSYDSYLQQQYDFTPMALIDLDNLWFCECYGEELQALSAILESLSKIEKYSYDELLLIQTYFPYLTQMLLRLEHIDLDMDSLITLTNNVVLEMQYANVTLESIKNIDSRIESELKALHTTLKISLMQIKIQQTDLNKTLIRNRIN